MGCGSSIEDQVLLAKLDRLEIQVKKEKELKKLSEIEGRPIGSMNQYNGFDTRTENKKRIKTTPSRHFDTYTSIDKSRKKKKQKKRRMKKQKRKRGLFRKESLKRKKRRNKL